MIAASEPEKARQVCEQYRVLYPDWGAAPWNEKIREIAVRLGVANAADVAGQNGDAGVKNESAGGGGKK